MADVTYRIILSSSGGTNTKKAAVAPTPQGREMTNPLSKFLGSAGEAIKTVVTNHYAVNMANGVISHEIGRVALRTGNRALQQALSTQYNAAKSIISIGATIATGIATGNPLTVMAGAMSIVTGLVELGQAQENINIGKAVNGVSVDMANIRAGAGGDRLGRQNF